MMQISEAVSQCCCYERVIGETATYPEQRAVPGVYGGGMSIETVLGSGTYFQFSYVEPKSLQPV
jgi:hypothetical protein